MGQEPYSWISQLWKCKDGRQHVTNVLFWFISAGRFWLLSPCLLPGENASSSSQRDWRRCFEWRKTWIPMSFMRQNLFQGYLGKGILSRARPDHNISDRWKREFTASSVTGSSLFLLSNDECVFYSAWRFAPACHHTVQVSDITSCLLGSKTDSL